MAILTKPFLLAKSTLKVPGWASRASGAPPTAITTALPPRLWRSGYVALFLSEGIRPAKLKQKLNETIPQSNGEDPSAINVMKAVSGPHLHT